jgi:hypothetical protein
VKAYKNIKKIIKKKGKKYVPADSAAKCQTTVLAGGGCRRRQPNHGIVFGVNVYQEKKLKVPPSSFSFFFRSLRTLAQNLFSTLRQ